MQRSSRRAVSTLRQPRATQRRLAGPAHAVAVVPDGAPAAGAPGRRDAALTRWVALGRGDRASAASPVTVTAREPALLSAGLRALPPALGDFVVLRSGPDPVSARVIRGSSATAAAVVAALLNVLRLRERAPAGCRVVVTGAAMMPALPSVLARAGFDGVTTWDGPGAGTPPLAELTGPADAVVDLLGRTWELARTAQVRPGLVILTPATPRWTLLALPGLIRAVAAAPPTELGPGVLHGCALAIAAAAPPGRVLPGPGDPAVADAVERAARAALP